MFLFLSNFSILKSEFCNYTTTILFTYLWVTGDQVVVMVFCLEQNRKRKENQRKILKIHTN